MLGQGFGEFVGIGNGDGLFIVAGDIVADSDGGQFHVRAVFDPADDVSEVHFENVCGVYGLGRVVDRGAVGNDHQDFAFFGSARDAVISPDEGFAVDIFLKQPFLEHQAEIFAAAAHGRLRGFINDVTDVIEPAGIFGAAALLPEIAGLAAFPGAGGKAEDFGLEVTTLQRLGDDIGGHGGNRDGPAAHGAGIVDQDGEDRVAEGHDLFLLEGQGHVRIGDDAGKAGGVEIAFLHVELPAPSLLGHEFSLQAVGELGDQVVVAGDFFVQHGPQAAEFFGVGEFLCTHGFVELRCEDGVVSFRAFDEILAAAGQRGVIFICGLIVGEIAEHIFQPHIEGCVGGRRRGFRIAHAGHGVALFGGLVIPFFLFAFPVRCFGGELILFPSLFSLAFTDRKPEFPQEFAGEVGELFLIFQGFPELCKGGCLEVLCDPWLPEVVDFPCRRGWGAVRHLCACDDVQGIGKTDALALGYVCESSAFAFFFQHSVEVIGYALHFQRAQRVASCLFKRIKGGLSLQVGVRIAPVQCRVVMCQLERVCIRASPHETSRFRGKVRIGHREACAGQRTDLTRGGFSFGKCDIQFRVAGDRAHDRASAGFKLFGFVFVLRHGIRIKEKTGENRG